MQSFINNICDFIWEIIYDLYYRVRFPGNTNITSGLDITTTNWNAFLDKQIFIGDLLNIGLTWRELFNYLLPIVLTTIFIIIFVKMILKIMGLFIEIWQ